MSSQKHDSLCPSPIIITCVTSFPCLMPATYYVSVYISTVFPDLTMPISSGLAPITVSDHYDKHSVPISTPIVFLYHLLCILIMCKTVL